MAELFAREREELIEAQKARRNTQSKNKEASPPVEKRVKDPETKGDEHQRDSELGVPPGLEKKNAGTQTYVGLPERVTVTWIPVAGALAPVSDGPNPE